MTHFQLVNVFDKSVEWFEGHFGLDWM